MSFYEEFSKYEMLQWLEKNCYPFEFKHARAAFKGDVKAAFSLFCALNNDKRGAVAVAMWRAKVPVEAFRAYLGSAWTHDHQHVIAAAKNRRNLGHMFRYAAFQLAAELPNAVKVWRGTLGVTVAQARIGYSWTTDRDIACWFAMRFAAHGSSPLVLTAQIAKTDISLFTSERNESEAVLMCSPTTVIADGEVSDWAMGPRSSRQVCAQ